MLWQTQLWVHKRDLGIIWIIIISYVFYDIKAFGSHCRHSWPSSFTTSHPHLPCSQYLRKSLLLIITVVCFWGAILRVLKWIICQERRRLLDTQIENTLSELSEWWTHFPKRNKQLLKPHSSLLRYWPIFFSKY